VKEVLSDAVIADFLRRSYFTVDGLWFVKLEQLHGFDEAMDMDEAVWKVMSKIQARKAKSLLGIEEGSLQELARAFQLKFAAEGYDYRVESEESEVRIIVEKCPWYEILKSSGRTSIAEPIADRICALEFAGWAHEFAEPIEFQMRKRLCVEKDNCDRCEFAFLSAKSSS